MTKFIADLHLDAQKQSKMESIIAELNRATAKQSPTETEILRTKISRVLISWGMKVTVKVQPASAAIAVRVLAACFTHAE